MISFRKENHPQWQHFCVAFILEYLSHRTKTLWGSSYRRLVNFFTVKPTDRKNECEELIKKIYAAATFKDFSDLIDEFSKKAIDAQKSKEGVVDQQILSLFIKDNSLWAKTLHALRTLLLEAIKKSDQRSALQEEIDQLNQKLGKLNEKMRTDLQKQLMITEVEIERNKIFLQLLNRQDWENIYFARMHHLFPHNLPSDEPFTLPPGISMGAEIPVFYHDNYHTIFYYNELLKTPSRAVDFTDHLKKQLQAKLHIKSVSVLDENFFNEWDYAEQPVEQSKVPTNSLDESAHQEPLVEPQNERTSSPAEIESNNDKHDLNPFLY